jgi:hypothetical protein
MNFMSNLFIWMYSDGGGRAVHDTSQEGAS